MQCRKLNHIVFKCIILYKTNNKSQIIFLIQVKYVTTETQVDNMEFSNGCCGKNYW